VSQLTAASSDQVDSGDVGVGRRFVVPSWVFSLLAHAVLLGSMATLTWTVTRQADQKEFTVGIMVRKDNGEVYESRDQTYEARQDQTAPSEFLPSDTPESVTQALPNLPEVDLATLGVSGSMLSGASDLIAPPDAGNVGPATNTQFFGAQVWGTKFVYVIDRSGSMGQRDRLELAKDEMRDSLARLPPEAQFQIIFYNAQPKMMDIPGAAKRLVSASDLYKRGASQFMDTIHPDGGTEHRPALEMAIKLQPDVIFFLTDADDLKAAVVQVATELNNERARIHTIAFGIGPEVDGESQLRNLAEKNGGTHRYIDAAALRGGVAP
jgi:Ca-activated chloride channel family protein